MYSFDMGVAMSRIPDLHTYGKGKDIPRSASREWPSIHLQILTVSAENINYIFLFPDVYSLKLPGPYENILTESNQTCHFVQLYKITLPLSCEAVYKSADSVTQVYK